MSRASIDRASQGTLHFPHDPAWHRQRRRFEKLKGEWKAKDADPRLRNRITTYKLRSYVTRLAHQLWPNRIDFDRHTADLRTSARK